MPDWVWAFKFPHNVIDAGIPIYGCMGEHCNQLLAGVYPTSFYEASICLLLFGFMWLLRKRIIIPGLMFYMYLIVSGAERLLIEQIRITEIHSFLGVVFTQAEFISVLMITGGMAGAIIIIFRRRKSIRIT